MEKISLFKKIKIFREFKKTIRVNKTEIQQVFGAKIDKAWRIYNVINIPIEDIGEPYNLRKSDIDKIAERYIREYTIDISKYLDSKGLAEMYEFYEIKKVSKYSYLIIIGFSLPNIKFRSNIYYDNIKFRVIPIITLLLIIYSLIYFLL